MIQLTKAGEYGIRAITYLVRRGNSAQVSIGEISKAQKIPEPFLRKLFRPLVENGIVETTRGIAGGVRLARPPEEIKILEIVEALEGPLALNQCLMENNFCEFIGECGMHRIWAKTQAAMADVLRQHDLTHLIR